MERFVIAGGTRLQGQLAVPPAKNAVLPALAATILAQDTTTITEVPDLVDTHTMVSILRCLGNSVEWGPDRSVKVTPRETFKPEIPENLMGEMRSSVMLMGPLLARFGFVRAFRPGGCDIGNRPIDYHEHGLVEMGANLTPRGNVVELEAKKLHGARIHLPYASVGATENIMMAATLAEGTTYIQNAAQEPEVVDLANLLTQMGAKVKGAGTSVIRIDGVENLRGVRYSVIPDRIVAGTFLIAGAITGGEVTITGCIPEHVESLTSRLTQFGAEVAVSGSSVTVNASRPLTGNIDVQTAPYPGFPTDLQAPLMALLTVVDGVSTVTETVFDGRFRHVGEFCRLGAEIKVVDRTAVVRGVNRLTGTNVKATDLRAGAALVLAGLAAQGVTVVENTTHVDRGYEKLEQHLSRIGAFIRRIGA